MVKQPKTEAPQQGKNKSKFSAFPIRDLPQQVQSIVEESPEKDTKSEPKSLLEPVLPTVRQPARSFAPTPLPQPQKSTERGWFFEINEMKSDLTSLVLLKS